MANIKSQIKRNKQNEKAHQRNKAAKSSLSTSVRRFREAADAGDPTRPGPPCAPLPGSSTRRPARASSTRTRPRTASPRSPSATPNSRPARSPRRAAAQFGSSPAGWRRSGAPPVPARRLRWLLRPSPARPLRLPRERAARCRSGASRGAAAAPGLSSTAGHRPRRRARRCWHPAAPIPPGRAAGLPARARCRSAPGKRPWPAPSAAVRAPGPGAPDRPVRDGEPGRLGPAPVVPGHDRLVDEAVGVGGELVAGGRELAQIRTHRVEQRPCRAVIGSPAPRGGTPS